jgi:hypothetical protein
MKTAIFAAFITFAALSSVTTSSAQVTANVSTNVNQPTVDPAQLQRLRCQRFPRACAEDQRTPPSRREAAGPKRNTRPGGQARP